MNRKDLDALNELYLSVYDEEQLNEKVGTALDAANELDRQGRGIAAAGLRAKAARVARGEDKPKVATDSGKGGKVTLNTPYASTLNNQPGVTRYQPIPGQPGRVARYFTPNKQQAEKPVKPTPAKPPATTPTAARTPAGSGSTPPPRPAARPSGPVLSKKDGVEGIGVGANFKARAFSAAEKSRYSSVAAQNAAKSSASTGTPKPSSPTPAASAPKPAIGVLGKTSFERRTPTSAELRAAQGERERQKTAGENTSTKQNSEKALQAAQKTNLPTTGPTPAIPSASSVAADVAKANSPAVINRPAPAGSALAAQQAQQKLKPPTPGTGIMQKQSYEWPSAKTIRDIAGAYSSIYEAKKKVDQDQDGDNDFADVRVARMIASGVPKAKAIAMVKDKSYNEEVELWVNELLEEGYDLSEYTWEDMFEIYEATAMAKRGYDETSIRNKIAKSTGGGESADRATALADRQTYGNIPKQASREKLARTQRGDFRRTTSSDYGLRLGAHKSDDPAVKAKQAARGKQRSALTPKEKKMLNREAYEAYEFVASYLLENNFASTVDDANVIINNMSEGWFDQIMEEKKPLPVAKMKRKESKLLDNEEGQLQALRTDVGSKERKARMKELQRFDNINSVRTSVAKRGGKQQHSMPEIGRYKPKDED